MAIILPQLPRQPGALEQLQTGLGQGLSSGIANLANMKMKAMQDQVISQNKYDRLIKSGVKPEIANLLLTDVKGIGSILDRLEGQFFTSPKTQENQTSPTGINNLNGLQSPENQSLLQQLGISNQQLGVPEKKEVPTTINQPQESGGLKFGASSAERRHRETLAQQKELAGQKVSEKLAEHIEEKAVPARNLIRKSKLALPLIKKAISGVFGRITPEYLQTGEGQLLQSLLNEIVIDKTKASPGRTTATELELQQGSKAKIWQKPWVIEEILNNIINDPEYIREAARAEAADDIIGRGEQLTRKNINETVSQLELKELPQTNYDDGTPVTNGDIIRSNGKKYQRENNQWIKKG